MNVEDRLTAALRGTAELVEDRPRPLPTASRRLSTASRRHGIPRFMPAWAALIIALVVLGPFILSDGELTAPVPMSSPSLDIGAAPEFYVAVYRATEVRKSRFEVRSTATGAVLDVNDAGNGEDFVSIASIPDDGREAMSSFYLLTRLGTGIQPGCTRYTIYGVQISADGRFSGWGGGAVMFEALDGTPANLATTPRGDEIAYSYEGCGRKEIVGGTEIHQGTGLVGEPMIAHHWAGSTTIWGAEGEVRNLAYTPDGHSLAVFRRRDAEAGEALRSELLLVRTAEPADTTPLLNRTDGGDGPLVNAMITPDGKRAVAVFGEPDGSGTRLSVAEYPLGEGGPSARDLLEPAVDYPVAGPVLLKQHPSGPELLLQAGDTTLFHGGMVKALVSSTEETPADVAW